MNYSVNITEEAEKHFNFFVKNDKKLIKKINNLIKDLEAHPKTGIGKPERLKYKEEELYSRRITQYHRMVYKVEDESKSVIIISLHGHYEDKK